MNVDSLYSNLDRPLQTYPDLWKPDVVRRPYLRVPDPKLDGWLCIFSTISTAACSGVVWWFMASLLLYRATGW